MHQLQWTHLVAGVDLLRREIGTDRADPLPVGDEHRGFGHGCRDARRRAHTPSVLSRGRRLTRRPVATGTGAIRVDAFTDPSRPCRASAAAAQVASLSRLHVTT